MTRHTILAAAAALTLIALTACGGARGDSGPTVDLERALNAFGHDVAAGDGEAACARLTRAGQADVIATFGLGDDTSCEAAVGVAAYMLTDEEKAAFDDFRIRRAHVKGDRAEVRDGDVERPPALTPAPDNGEPAVFRRVAGRWLLEDLG